MSFEPAADAPSIATSIARFAGVDEAGRGPLAGPVVVAAVVFAPGRTPINGLADSKQLQADRRAELYELIVRRAIAYKIVSVEVEDIDRLNIFHATMLGMRMAVEGVLHACEFARIDGNAIPRDLPCRGEAIVGGDATERAIMAASILAKVTRDRHMVQLHQQWPQYGFDEHKGYSTPQHLAALRAHGPCPQHRRSFTRVRDALQGNLIPLADVETQD
ncbi:ribonuclease HII [Noviluteimonas lactosilytica]|uniref:ribonuclease HII n=1 Tax=Noviluteimonas lactosilytica TaxID=2888523 RepID=UPI0031BA1642